MKSIWCGILAAILGIAGICHGGELFSVRFDKPESLAQFKANGSGAQITEVDGLPAMVIKSQDTPFTEGVYLTLDPEQVAGHFVTIKSRIKRDIGLPSRKYNGGKLMLQIATPDENYYPGVPMAPGRFDWEDKTLNAFVPDDAREVLLYLGIQNASGEICYRDLTIEVGDRVVNLRDDANMGFRDETPGDGKGGWSDQGPDNDAAKLNYKNNTFGGVPFGILDPEKNGGSSIMVFKAPSAPFGLSEAAIDMEPVPVKSRYLYLLHTLTWGSEDPTVTGYIELTGDNGKTQKIELRNLRDVADWWMPKSHENAGVGNIWVNNSGGEVGVYVSRFEISPDIGGVSKITFTPSGNVPVWIVVAATLSDNLYELPTTEKLVIDAGQLWRPVDPRFMIAADSALDLSGVYPREPVGARGRVIVNRDGRLAFEKTPEKAERFLAVAEALWLFHGDHNGEWENKEYIDAYVDQLVKAGYNMIRMHFFDTSLMLDRQAAYDINPDVLDRFDYFISKAKENGIYINLDIMSSRYGYAKGNPWEHEWNPNYKDDRDFKIDIYLDAKVRENWRKGAEMVLTHLNPYTNTRLADDPVLALIVGYNEQEFAFGEKIDWSRFTPAWRQFVKDKYDGDIAALNRAWGTAISSFEEVPELSFKVVMASNSVFSIDANLFVTECERDILNFYITTLRELGCKAPVSNFNMGKNLRYTLSRKGVDFVSMNAYHAHPAGNIINQLSSIVSAGNHLRGIAANKIWGRPFVVTEHGHVFWNQFRYEQSFLIGAYAAFQDMDVLSDFASQITVHGGKQLKPFLVFSDPIAKSQEFLTALMFMRRDVATAPGTVVIDFSEQDIYERKLYNDGLNSAQSRLALVTGIALRPEWVERGGAAAGFPVAGGSAVTVRKMDSSIEETKNTVFDFDEAVKTLKASGVLSGDNPSRATADDEVYQSSTDEILMVCKDAYMQIDTPRLQGVCALPGKTAKLSDFELIALGEKGNLAAAAVDGEKSLRDAERIVLVYATNALNSGMEFEDESMRNALKMGDTPVLLKSGSFTVKLQNKNSAALKAYALRLDGTRMCELPLTADKESVTLQVDTAGLPEPTVYFELSAR